MPTHMPQVPPQTPPGSPPPEPGRTWRTYMQQQGYQIVDLDPGYQPQWRNVFNTEANRQRDMAEHPFRTFFGDLGRTLRNTVVDVIEDGATPTIAAEMLSMWRDAKSIESTEANVQQVLRRADTKSPIDILMTMGAASFMKGATMGMEHLPVFGESLNVLLSPTQQRLDEAASTALRANIMAMDGTIGKLAFAEAPAITAGIGGTLTGATALFKPFMGLGRIVMGAPQAAALMRSGTAFTTALRASQSGFIGDIAGFGIYGAMTGERGLLVSAVQGEGEPLEIEIDDNSPWWLRGAVGTANRMTAAGQMMAEGFVYTALEATLVGAFMKVPAFRRAEVASLRRKLTDNTDVTASDILAARGIITDPGMRRQVIINDPQTAALAVDMRAADELIQRSDKAMTLLAEQNSVEGIVSYQSGIAALATALHDLSVADHATIGILRNIDDPYRMYEQVFKEVGAKRITSRGTRSPEIEADTRRLNLLRQARADMEGGDPRRLRAHDRAINELETSIAEAEAANLPIVPEIVSVKRDPVPLVHGRDEVPEEALFGYLEGHSSEPLLGVAKKIDPNQPLYLRRRPNLMAADAGRIEETVVIPGKTVTYDSYNELLEKFGSLDDAYRTLKKRNVDTVIIERGGAMEREVIVLDAATIKSSRHVTPQAIQSAPNGLTDAEIVMRNLANEPLEVALSKRMPDFIFEVPVKRADGTYDILFRRRGAPGMSKAQMKQFKNDGFFAGQKVLYGGAMYEFLGVKGTKMVTIKHPTTGDELVVARRNIQDFGSGSTDLPVDEALFREFRDYFDQKLGLIADKQMTTKGLRDMIKRLDDPGTLKRDMSGQDADIMIYPNEVLTDAEISTGLQMQLQTTLAHLQQLAPVPENGQQIMRLQAQVAEIQMMIREQAGLVRPLPQKMAELDIDKAYITFPDPLDYYTLIFKRFLSDKGIEPTSVGELDALKFSFARRLNQELFAKLPRDVRTQFSKLQTELRDAWEALPLTLDNKAKLSGYQVVRTREGGIMLHRPGSMYYEGMYTSDLAAEAALDRALRYAGAPNLTPQLNWLNFALPHGPGVGQTAGSKASDMWFLADDSAAGYLAGVEGVPLEFTKSKPRWALLIEEKTGIPLWTEFLEPLFNARTQAANAEYVFVKPFVEAHHGLTVDERKQIGSFFQTFDKRNEFLDRNLLKERAKQFGLSSPQVAAVDAYRTAMDDMFALGMKWYGWAPEDYIWNYFTRMRPQHSALLSTGRDRQYSFLPKDMDIFMSKYRRQGMLADTEDDPLVVGLKYMRTFFHEHYVGAPYERLRGFMDTKFKDLPAEQFNKVRDLMPVGKRENVDIGDYALPPAIRGPLNEMLLYMRGYPQAQDDLVTNIGKGIFSRLGIDMDSRIVSEASNTLMSLHYGATLAFRGRPVVRNTYQVISNMYPRVGATAVGIGYRKALTSDAYRRAIADGILNIQSRGVHLGEELVMTLLEEVPIQTKGLGSAIGAGLFRAALVDGKLPRVIRRFTEKGLSGIKNTDEFTRIWAAEAQEAYTRPIVERYLQGKLDQDELFSKGLTYFEMPVKRHFAKLLDEQGSEAALSYIRREASTVTNYTYGAGAQPMWAQRPTGRMAYAYGTWGLWWKDLQFRNFRGATNAKEYATLAARYAITAGALTGVGMQLGLDMGSWMAHNSVLTYGGGPLVSFAGDALNVMESGSWEYKTQAVQELARRNIMRTAVPGQMFFEDITESLKELPYPERSLLLFTVGRETDDIRAWGLDQFDYLEKGGALNSPPQTSPAPEMPPLPPQ